MAIEGCGMQTKTDERKDDMSKLDLRAEADMHNAEAARLATELVKAIEGHAGSVAEGDIMDAIRRETEARDDALEAVDGI